MKLLGIHAGRRMGNCEMLVKSALQGAQLLGCQVQYLRLQDYRIEPCVGCTACVSRELAGLPTRCSIPESADDLALFARLVMEADGLIIASPSYNFSIAGRLMDALNREHSFMGQLKELCRETPKYAATIGVAGSDRDNFLMPMLNFAAAEYCGSRLCLVDQMLVEYIPTPAAVVEKDAAMLRAFHLGENLAQALLSGSGEYRGDAPELCPVCHGDHLQLRGGQLICPTCDIVAHVREADGKPVVEWESGFEKSRWSEYGHQRHIEKVRAGHAANSDAEAFRRKLDPLRNYLSPVTPAEAATMFSDTNKEELL